MTPYEKHRQRWGKCRKCALCKGRTKVVLARGRVPCDVLFVGEAPGASEDVIGRPFVGPAGKLLDRIVTEALDPPVYDEVADPDWVPARIAFTNLVACIPKGEEGTKIGEPDNESITACAPRLREFMDLSRPKRIVAVGSLAAKQLPLFAKVNGERLKAATVSIVHPAAILRADISQRGLAVQRCIATLADLFSELSG